MNTWPCETWQELEEYRKETEYVRQRIKEEKQKINEHFNMTMYDYSEWIEKHFNESALMQDAANMLIKYSSCENCKHYVGPNPIQRKLYNISVLSGYCIEHIGITTPDFRCNKIEFDPLWEQIMEIKLSKLKRYKFPFDKVLKKSWDNTKQMFEDGSLDAY